MTSASKTNQLDEVDSPPKKRRRLAQNKSWSYETEKASIIPARCNCSIHGRDFIVASRDNSQNKTNYICLACGDNIVVGYESHDINDNEEKSTDKKADGNKVCNQEKTKDKEKTKSNNKHDENSNNNNTNQNQNKNKNKNDNANSNNREKYKCKIQIIKGDLFTCSNNASLAHCISRDLAMGKGIAKLFKEKFGNVKQLRRM